VSWWSFSAISREFPDNWSFSTTNLQRIVVSRINAILAGKITVVHVIADPSRLRRIDLWVLNNGH